MFNFFLKRPHQSFSSALPRTVATIAAAKCAKAGLIFGTGIGTFAATDWSTGNLERPGMAVTTAIACTTAAAGCGYAVAYANTNLWMAAFPMLKEQTSRFLLSPGVKSHRNLFLAVVLFDAVSMGIDKLLTNESESNSRPSGPGL